MSDLEVLIASAKAASSLDRVDFRDPIAAYGAEAIEAVLPWALGGGPPLAWFAVGVIDHASRFAPKPVVVDALSKVATSAPDPKAREDAATALHRLRPASSARPATLSVTSIPRDAGKSWPGFQKHEFDNVTGTVWRGRSDPASLSAIVTTTLRYYNTHFESYAIYHLPEVHFGIRDRYQQGGEHAQGWRAAKIVIYAHGPEADGADDIGAVTCGLYIEKGLEERWNEEPDSLSKFGLLDDRWDWWWLVRGLRDEHLTSDLGAAMAAHALTLGDYHATGFAGRGLCGWSARLEGGVPTVRDADGQALSEGWEGVRTAMESASPRKWVDLHLFRTWPAREAIAEGRDFVSRNHFCP